MYRYQNVVGDNRYEEWKKDPSLFPLKFTYAGRAYCGLAFPKISEEITREGAKETYQSVFALDKKLLKSC